MFHVLQRIYKIFTQMGNYFPFLPFFLLHTRQLVFMCGQINPIHDFINFERLILLGLSVVCVCVCRGEGGGCLNACQDSRTVWSLIIALPDNHKTGAFRDHTIHTYKIDTRQIQNRDKKTDTNKIDKNRHKTDTKHLQNKYKTETIKK